MKKILFYLVFNFVSAAGCMAAPDVYARGNCSPCLININNHDAFLIYYDLAEVDGEVLIERIRVSTPEGVFFQNLEIADMVPATNVDNFFLGSPDINFDGSEDLYLITSYGATNAYAKYWLFDKSSRRFIPIGVFPIFTLHEDSKTLSTHENLGSGGRDYVKRVYRIKDKGIDLLYKEKQLRDPKIGKFKISKKGNP